MKKNRKKWILLLSIGLLVLVLALGFHLMSRKNLNTQSYIVKPSNFNITLLVKGEIKSTKTGSISLPPSITDRELGLWNIEIDDMVEEGTKVKKGDFIAQLATNNIQSQISDLKQRINEYESSLAKSRIDNQIQLDNLQKEIDLMDYDLQSAKLDVEQSIYESAAYQRKVKMAYDNLLRKQKTKQRNYLRTEIYLKNRYRKNEKKWKEAKAKEAKLEKALADTRVLAPKDGLVMYARTYWGEKITKGSSISRWDPVFATLPDLSHLISEIYLEEVYISKVKLGDSVQISIDALNGLRLAGRVNYVANVGQEMKGYNSKVFRVEIAVNQQEKTIMPYMNTSNTFTVEQEQNVIAIPNKYLNIDEKGSYVMERSSFGWLRKSVKVKASNPDQSWIEEGLKVGDVIGLEK